LLDRAGKNPVTWIVGPPGAGKTTLVASYLKARKRRSLWYRFDEGDADLSSFFHYLGMAATHLAPRHREPLPALTPEYALGLQTFVRRYFERLCHRLPRDCVLVFDNYQDVPSTAPLHQLLPVALQEIPQHVSVVVMSREAPPAGFASLVMHQQLMQISPDELQLTSRETRQLIRLFQPKARPADARRIEALAGTCFGWVAEVILLLDHATREATFPSVQELSSALFGYLASEAIGRLPPERQEFLVKTSLLPEMTVE